jgi:hypothetical protein
VQAVPLSVNTVGFGLLPGCDPLNPTSTLPPAAIVPFHGAFDTATDAPVWLKTPDQPFVTCCDDGNVNASFQAFIAVEPLFVIVTDAVKPVFQSLVV